MLCRELPASHSLQKGHYPSFQQSSSSSAVSESESEAGISDHGFPFLSVIWRWSCWFLIQRSFMTNRYSDVPLLLPCLYLCSVIFLCLCLIAWRWLESAVALQGPGFHGWTSSLSILFLVFVSWTHISTASCFLFIIQHSLPYRSADQTLKYVYQWNMFSKLILVSMVMFLCECIFGPCSSPLYFRATLYVECDHVSKVLTSISLYPFSFFVFYFSEWCFS